MPASSIVRVELKGTPSRADYDTLHEQMRRAGFKQTITGSNQVTYALPHAEYYGRGLDGNTARERAKDAAATVWTQFQVLATESAGEGSMFWYGLEPA